MRIRKLLAVPLLALAFAGCIKEDLSKCIPVENVTLRFTYSGTAAARFTDYINKVDLFLFDAQGKYLFHRSAENGELSTDQPGITLTLDPGTYYALAWGNVMDNSGYQNLTAGVTSLAECLVEINPASTRTGDPVYYAPHKPYPGVSGARSTGETRADTDMSIYEVVVPAQGHVEKTLDFIRAHRSIYVWVRGFQDAGGEHPTVDARQLWSKYDFYFRTKPDRRNYRQQAGERDMDGKVYSLAVFHHAYGEIDDDMNIDVRRTSDGELSATVGVRQFLEENPTSGTDDIHIMLTFVQDLGVTVTLPEWISKPVQPGID